MQSYPAGEMRMMDVHSALWELLGQVPDQQGDMETFLEKSHPHRILNSEKTVRQKDGENYFIKRETYAMNWSQESLDYSRKRSLCLGMKGSRCQNRTDDGV